MNKIMFDIMLYLDEKNEWDSGKAAKALYKPYSVIEQEYRNLKYDEYVDDKKLTDKAEKYLQTHKIDNAIILAAGVSTRFVPLCFEQPKSLLTVKGEVLIERQINQLKEKGINDITIVVGFMKEKFDYLRDKYGVSIVETEDYRIRNNHASVYAAKAKLGNTIITSSDLYFTKNIFQTYAYDAYYCTIYQEGDTEERGVTTDAYDRITDTAYGVADSWVTLGYAYFNKRFSDNFIDIVEKEWNLPRTRDSFWADIQDRHLAELYMYAKRCDQGVIYEFDSLEELRQFDDSYQNDAHSSLLAEIARNLSVPERSLTNLRPITKEDLGLGFTFSCDGRRYICRIGKDLSIEVIRRFDDEIQELAAIVDSFESYYDKTLPLCAAENVISDFANMPLQMGFQERYIVGNTYSYMEADNFIGSTYLLPFYEMISEKCRTIFGAKYTDSRTLTGMNCLMMVMSSLAKAGDHVMILGSSAGGHASVKPICERLGLVVSEVPYDFERYDLDFPTLNRRLKEEHIEYILLAPSDLIQPLHVTNIELGDTVLLYDASQTLGLIGAGVVENPLGKIDNFVMFGGTHKTFPGPASGLIMTNNDSLHERLERTINPIYIRHTQMHQKVSLLFALVEFESFGKPYQQHIVELSQALAMELEQRGFNIAHVGDMHSTTHQVFILTDKEMMERIFANSLRYGITLNKKKKRLFNGFGIRLGTQEIARYDWPVESMKIVADIIVEIAKPDVDSEKVTQLLHSLPDKKAQFTFDETVTGYFKRFMGQKV